MCNTTFPSACNVTQPEYLRRSGLVCQGNPPVNIVDENFPCTRHANKFGVPGSASNPAEAVIVSNGCYETRAADDNRVLTINSYVGHIVECWISGIHITHRFHCESDKTRRQPSDRGRGRVQTEDDEQNLSRLRRPREAPSYVSGKFAYFWGENWSDPGGNLHILRPLGDQFWPIFSVYCIFLGNIWENFRIFPLVCWGLRWRHIKSTKFTVTISPFSTSHM
jgi:hypothetical protein